MRAKCDDKIEFSWKKKQLTTTSLKQRKTKGMTTTNSCYRWCPRPTRRSRFRSFSLHSSRSRHNATFTEGEKKKKNEFASGIKPPVQSSSSSTGGERRKKKKTKETDEEEEKSINKTKTNGWQIFDVHIDATEDSGKDDFSISKPILERVCKVLHLDIEDIEDDIEDFDERKMKKTSIETILQRNDDYMMKQRIRVARKSCDARGGGGGGIARRTKTKNANDYHEEEEDDDDKHRVQFSYVIDVSDEFVEMCGGSAKRVRAERKKVERTKMEEKVDVNGFSRDDEFKEEKNKNKKRTVVIVGLGPAGLFCALTLARLSADTKVVILERGEPVERRGKAIGALFHRRRLSETSNLCYGEGGAGTWSDGKLTTRIGRNGEEVKDVFKTFVEFGAPPEILQMGKPHLGTDRMVKILRNARYELEKMGCEIMFDETCRTVMVEDNEAVGVTTESGKTIHAEAVVLATGHSSRALFEQLSNDGVLLEFQSFASGFRIEHPQELLNELQYGERFAKEVERGKGRIPVADYRVAHTNKEDNRGVFSFCMCPGGQIVPTSTNVHELCINGMSFSRRQSLWANSGLVTNVKLEDCAPFNDEHETKPHLSGILFQQDIERKAAVLGGGDLTVPVQTAHDFLLGVVSDEKSLPSSSYRLGIKSADLTTLYPQHLTEAIQFALKKFDKQMPGYAGKEALIHAPETRTSSPVRIVRNSESLESENTKNLFPIGEGAGYAGGIVSAAVDGMCASKKVLAKLLKVV